MQNPMCDGAHCQSSTGEVRLYQLGGGGNLILCQACWLHENRYRRERGVITGRPANWPEPSWDAAEVYDPTA